MAGVWLGETKLVMFAWGGVEREGGMDGWMLTQATADDERGVGTVEFEKLVVGIVEEEGKKSRFWRVV